MKNEPILFRYGSDANLITSYWLSNGINRFIVSNNVLRDVLFVFYHVWYQIYDNQ